MNQIKKHQNQKRYVVSIFLLLANSVAFSQVNSGSSPHKSALPDSISQKALAYAMSKFAIARPFNVEFTMASPIEYTLKPQGNEVLPNGKLTSFNQIKASTNYNFLKKKRWMLGATLDFRYYNIGADLDDPIAPKSVNNSYLFHTSALNFTYFSKLFGKTVIYGSSLMVDGSEERFERVRGLVYGTMVLKANSRTKMTAGAVVNIGPNYQFPALPVFTYEQKFQNNFVLDIILPKQILLRKYYPRRSRVSIGVEMDQSDFFFYNINTLNSSLIYEFQQTNANAGITYEHLLGGNFILTFRTGARIPFGGRFYEKSDVKNPLFKLSSDPSLYFNMGLSWNPFIPKNKK